MILTYLTIFRNPTWRHSFRYDSTALLHDVETPPPYLRFPPHKWPVMQSLLFSLLLTWTRYWTVKVPFGTPCSSWCIFNLNYAMHSHVGKYTNTMRNHTNITMTLYDRHGVSNHRQLGSCLFNSLSSLLSNKRQCSASLGIHRWIPSDAEHWRLFDNKEPVTQKAFPSHDVIMYRCVYIEYIARIISMVRALFCYVLF